eukprot:5569978-Prymnesium_polylepis.1
MGACAEVTRGGAVVFEGVAAAVAARVAVEAAWEAAMAEAVMALESAVRAEAAVMAPETVAET